MCISLDWEECVSWHREHLHFHMFHNPLLYLKHVFVHHLLITVKDSSTIIFNQCAMARWCAMGAPWQFG